jgi:E3 ubiquitin-protein ligase RNF14
MSCLRCHTYFCWICLAQLNPRCPYLHFSEPTSKCNLFEGIEHGDRGSDDEDDDRFVWTDDDDDSSDDDNIGIRWINAI